MDNDEWDTALKLLRKKVPVERGVRNDWIVGGLKPGDGLMVKFQDR